MAGGDLRHSRRRPPSTVAAWGPVLLVLAVLAAAFLSFEYDAGRRLGLAAPAEPAEVEPPSGLELPDLPAAPPVAAATAERSVVDQTKVRRALRGYLEDDVLGRHVAVAVGGPDGDVHFDNAGRATVPASTMKLLTGLASLEALGAERTFSTRVVRGERRREVVLVGGGDPYLASKPGSRSDYPPKADLRTLARRTAEALRSAGLDRVRVGFDDSLFSGPTASPHWRPSYIPEDVVSPITALWVDEGREQEGNGFADDPSRAAADVFSDELERAGIAVRGDVERAVAGDREELAQVEGAPVWQLVERMIAVSDNEGAEVLAHHVGLVEGYGGSFAGATKGVRATLDSLGVPLRRAVIRDGSGLSRDNRLTAETLLAVLATASRAGLPELRSVVTGLPVAGFNGSLAGRFDDVPAGGPGRVRAKTGTLSGVHGLAGVTQDLDGNVLTFVLLADRVRLEDTLGARETLDQMASALASCHCS